MPVRQIKLNQASQNKQKPKQNATGQKGENKTARTTRDEPSTVSSNSK